MNNPYPGLRFFRENEESFFFGRKKQISELHQKLAEKRFLAVLGVSGCGKSSLVRAGLIPRLKKSSLDVTSPGWEVMTMRPGKHPVKNLAKSLLECFEKSEEEKQFFSQEKIELLSANLWSSGLSKVLSENISFKLKDSSFESIKEKSDISQNKSLILKQEFDKPNILILVDQFEDVFHHRNKGKANDFDEFEKFVDLLLEVVQQTEYPIFVIITMRSDFLGECPTFQTLPMIMNDRQYLTPRLNRDECRAAIMGPAHKKDGTIEIAVVNRLLDEMENSPDQLPLLQHCLMRMWQHATGKRHSKKLTKDDYIAVGGLQNALSLHADEAYKDLSNDRQRKIAEIMFRRLCEWGENQGTRRPTPINEIVGVAGEVKGEKVTIDEVKSVVDIFSHQDRQFIIKYSESLQPETILDLCHESLITQWEKLDEWANKEKKWSEDYLHLQKSAINWKEHGKNLLLDAYLNVAQEEIEKNQPNSIWAKRYGIDDIELIRDFLNASFQKQKEIKNKSEQDQLKTLEAEKKARLEAEQRVNEAEKRKKAEEKARLEAEQRANEATAREKAESNLRQEAEKREQGEAKHNKQLWSLVLILCIVSFIAIVLAISANHHRKSANDAREEAEFNRSSFEVMVNSIFGFVPNNEKSHEFIAWIEDNSSVEQLIPALRLMIDSSESISKERKTYWKDILIEMNEEGILRLFNMLGAEVSENLNREERQISIESVIMTDENDQETPCAKSGIFTLRHGQRVNLRIQIHNPNNLRFIIRVTTAGDIIESTVPYTTPEAGENVSITVPNISFIAPKRKDGAIISIEVMNINKSKILARKAIKIDIAEQIEQKNRTR